MKTLSKCMSASEKTLQRPIRGLLAPLLAVFVFACGGGGGGNAGGPVVAPSYVAAPASAPVVKAPVECSAVLYGDSVMRGESSKGPLMRRPVDELRRLLPAWRIEDRSASGGSLTLDQFRVLNDDRTGFRAVVLSFGINDMVKNWDVKAPLGRLIDVVRAEGRTAIVTGLIATHDTRTDAYNEAELTTAIDHHAAFVSWGERAISIVDEVHPDQAMSDGLAADLAAVLVRELPDCAP